MSISAVQHMLKALEIKSERPDYDGSDMSRGGTNDYILLPGSLKLRGERVT